jgi:hypothetical protein
LYFVHYFICFFSFISVFDKRRYQRVSHVTAL